MKQVTKTSEIIARLNRAIGTAGAHDNLAVYEAIALNSRPLRKRHPLYKGAVAQRSMLLEMAASLESESVPLQIQHEGGALPIGRIFYGEVIDQGADTELRVLFWVDKTHAAHVASIDNGTVDQVSVGVLSRQLLCSADGFDFFGPEATFEHIYTGTTPKGHTVGKNGVFAQMNGLDQWFEMSLVGKGGAENARIVSNDNSHFGQNLQRLVATGAGIDHLILSATADLENDTMDPKDLIASLTASVSEAATLKATNTSLEASVTALSAEKVALTAQIAELQNAAPALTAAQTQVTELTAEKTTLEASLATADTALRDVLTKVLTASGKVDATLPTDLAEVVTQINDTSAGLVAALASTGKSNSADTGGGNSASGLSMAFRSNRNR